MRSARNAVGLWSKDLEPWLRTKLQLISQKTKLAAAIRYTLSRWKGLCLFLEDGHIETG